MRTVDLARQKRSISRCGARSAANASTGTAMRMHAAHPSQRQDFNQQSFRQHAQRQIRRQRAAEVPPMSPTNRTRRREATPRAACRLRWQRHQRWSPQARLRCRRHRAPAPSAPFRIVPSLLPLLLLLLLHEFLQNPLHPVTHHRLPLCVALTHERRVPATHGGRRGVINASPKQARSTQKGSRFWVKADALLPLCLCPFPRSLPLRLLSRLRRNYRTCRPEHCNNIIADVAI